MRAKILIRVLLLAFVGVSVAVLAGKQFPKTETTPISKSNTGSNAVRTYDRVHGDKVLVYYFHGTARCQTCKRIETLTRQSLEKYFAKVLENGSLEMRVRNVELAGNQHFIRDYQLSSPSVVVTQIKDGKEVKWKRLDQVWELVHTPTQFQEYVQNEVNLYLGDQG